MLGKRTDPPFGGELGEVKFTIYKLCKKISLGGQGGGNLRRKQGTIVTTVIYDLKSITEKTDYFQYL
jgi:hypothetical protein